MLFVCLHPRREHVVRAGIAFFIGYLRGVSHLADDRALVGQRVAEHLREGLPSLRDLDRGPRLDLPRSRERLAAEIAAWECERNASGARIRWMFTAAKAREKMGRAYPELPHLQVAA